VTRPLAETLAAALAPLPPGGLGVAVSGGGDSMALLHLLAELSRAEGFALRAATVDHGLRPEAAAEAALVAKTCASLGIPHETLTWRGWQDTGNLQAAARAARYDLLADWARAAGLGAVALGHTAEDQAETLLMRLGRRAGVDGLSGMQGRREDRGMLWLRPLLRSRRAELRDWLSARGLDWIEDPSNRDRRFERVRIRKALALLEPLGIGVEALTEVAGNLALAREALARQTEQTARTLASLPGGAVRLARPGFDALPLEIRRRLLVKALAWVGGAPWGARRAPVMAALEGIAGGQGSTLGGCQLLVKREALWVCREPRAVVGLTCAPGELWDRRWRLTPGPALAPREGLSVAALGPEGLGHFPEWREKGLPRPLLLASPALWHEGAPVAAALVGAPQTCHAEVRGGEEAFFAALLSH